MPWKREYLRVLRATISITTWKAQRAWIQGSCNGEIDHHACTAAPCTLL